MAEDWLLTLGQPLALERDRRAQLGLPQTWDENARGSEPEDGWKSGAFDMAPEIAAALGTSPLALTAHTPVHGTGMLALTPYALAQEGA